MVTVVDDEVGSRLASGRDRRDELAVNQIDHLDAAIPVSCPELVRTDHLQRVRSRDVVVQLFAGFSLAGKNTGYLCDHLVARDVDEVDPLRAAIAEVIEPSSN